MSARVMLAAAVISAAGCGGGSGPTPGTVLLSVGGDYTMAVALAESGCGAVAVEPLPTRVAQTPGALEFQLTHGPATYAGTLDREGGFVTQPRSFNDGVSTQTVSITGHFTRTGFDAVATVDVQVPGAPSCRYVVRWTGTKIGSPNVIP
jgi:hypothetical protein